MSIQRYRHDGSVMRGSTVGKWVTYDDHVAVVSETLDKVLEAMKLYEYEADYCTAIHACDLETAIDRIRGES